MGNTTRIENIDGDLLWAPDTVTGEYSIDKIKEIKDILSDLMSNVSLNMNMKVDEESLSNIYTKTQSDERFVINSNFDSLLQSKISELVVNNVIPGQSTLDLFNTRLLALWTACHGTNFNGETIQNISYDGSLQDHENKIYANTQDILRVVNDIYYKGSDGSTVDFNNPRFAMVSDTGKTDDLSSNFSGTNRQSLAKAINYVYTLINNRNTLIGSGNLKTNATTLVSAVNELYDTKAPVSDISSLSGTVSQLATQVNNLTNTMPGTSYSYVEFANRMTNVESRVTTLENTNGTATLQTDNKTLKGAINELKSSIGDVATVIGNLNSLDSSASASNVVSAINKLATVISGLTSRIVDLESKVNNTSGE